MKVVDWKEMMTMPIGTIFQEWKPCMLGPIYVFGGALTGPDRLGRGAVQTVIDYVIASFGPEYHALDSFGEMKADVVAKFGVPEGDFDPVVYPSGFGRDGMFDRTRRYLIWEDADRKKMAEWLLDPKKCADEQNDDPHALIAIPSI